MDDKVCANPAMTDQLPELLHGKLRENERARVAAHVAGCPACKSELALLALVRDSAARPIVDAGTIAAAIPPYRSRAAFWRRPEYLRIAAGIVVVAGISIALLARTSADMRGRGPSEAPPRQAVASSSQEATAEQPAATVPAPPKIHSISRPAVKAETAELALVGGLSELSYESLAVLAAELGSVEPVFSAEPDAAKLLVVLEDEV